MTQDCFLNSIVFEPLLCWKFHGNIKLFAFTSHLFCLAYNVFERTRLVKDLNY